MKIIGEWFKSSDSTAANNCVSVFAHPTGEVDVRNSKDPQGPVVSFTQDEWAAFIAGAKRGEFNPF